MIPIKFNKAMGRGDKFVRWQEKEGVIAFEKFGYTFVADVEEEMTADGEQMFLSFEISEMSTGFRVNFDTPALSGPEAIDRAIKFLDGKGEYEVKRVIETAKSKIILDNVPSPTAEPPAAAPSGSE